MFNSVMLTGRLTEDPELTFRDNVDTCCFSIAVQYFRRNGCESGEDIFDCIARKNIARVITEKFKKNDKFTVMGSLRISTDSENIKSFLIAVDDVQYKDGTSTFIASCGTYFSDEEEHDEENDGFLDEYSYDEMPF